MTEDDDAPASEAFDANDPQQVEKAKREAEAKAKAYRKILSDLASTPQGRDWLWRLFEKCHLFSPSFMAGRPDVSAFREGERNIGNMIFIEMEVASPESFALMFSEHRPNV